MDIITGALSNGSGFDAIYLDFIKAFDRVAHSRLVLKFKSVDISGSLLSYLIHFL